MDKLANRDQVHLRDGNNIDYDVDNLTNRYDSVGGSALTYDAAGNLTKDKNGYTYYYDYENRPTKIKKSNDTVTVAEFSYDALGRRIEKKDSITSANTRRYYYNYNWQILSEYDSGGTTHKRSYVYGNYIDEVLMSFWFYAASQCKYYLHDHLYSSAAIADYFGQVVERYEYDAYGKCYIMDASYNPRSASQHGNPYYFTGREMDTLDNGNLKLNNHRHRYYDTYTGRFIRPDPLGIVPNAQQPNFFAVILQYKDGINLYEYAQSNPLTFVDSIGLKKEEPMLDLNLLWSYIKLFSGDSDKSKCWAATVGLNKLKLHDTWTTGFCPPVTNQIFGWSTARLVLENKIIDLFPLEKYRACEFPCICDLRKGWKIDFGSLDFSAGNAGLTLYWGMGFSLPGFTLSPDGSHQFGCTFHFDIDISVKINLNTGSCCSPEVWLEEPLTF